MCVITDTYEACVGLTELMKGRKKVSVLCEVCVCESVCVCACVHACV